MCTYGSIETESLAKERRLTMAMPTGTKKGGNSRRNLPTRLMEICPLDQCIDPIEDATFEIRNAISLRAL